MKAAVWHGVKDIRVEDVTVKEVTGNKVKVKVEWAGICGSDLHAYMHDLSASGAGIPVDQPHFISGRKAPLTMGHEFSGIVTEVGPEATHVSIGDRVAIEPIIRDEASSYVQKGFYNLGRFGLVGFSDDGGFAEYAVVEDYMVHKVPDHVSMEEAAMVEPLAVVMRGLTESNFKAGMTAAVFGAGPIGLLTVLALKAAGARDIYLVDIVEERLALGKEIGATRVINSLHEKAEEVLASLTEDGVDIAFEVAGVQPTLDSAMNVVRKGGEIVVLSVFAESPRVNFTLMMLKELRLLSTYCYRNNYEEVIGLMASGQINVKPLITSKIPLDEIVENGFDKLVSDKKQAKILVRP
ncbi:2,3-butanediol dehydrogenase [Lysinibacillus sp. KU-BSD001]|uniref:2,3-butanediol dehydrogenase n=1 Tax=Lysinibacillus sp. KU-BSD001 TaxID=3141328 RepID=UPI0036E70990